MKKFLLGVLGAVTLVSSASAADMAARPYKAPPPVLATVYDWSGFYVGANGGWGSSRKCWDNVVTPTFIFGEGCHDATGGTLGGQVGYRWQASSWVFGLEAQGNWADFNGRNVSQFFGGFTNDTHVGAFGLFTGQIGYAFNNALFYLKGGAAVTSDRYRVLLTPTGAPVTNDVNDTRWGAVVGVGLEYGFASNWSVGIEYDHMFMQDRDSTFVTNSVLGILPAGTLFGTDRIRQDVDLVTVRLNYRWGGAVVAKY